MSASANRDHLSCDEPSRGAQTVLKVNCHSEVMRQWKAFNLRDAKLYPVMPMLMNTIFLEKRRHWKCRLLIHKGKGQEAEKCHWSGSEHHPFVMKGEPNATSVMTHPCSLLSTSWEYRSMATQWERPKPRTKPYSPTASRIILSVTKGEICGVT